MIMSQLSPPLTNSPNILATRHLCDLAVYRLLIYDKSMIKSFRCTDTQALFETGSTRRWTDIKTVAIRKLTQLAFLRSPPGNRLEAMSGNRAGQHSIRINEQWRLCFIWRDGEAHDVEIVDYH
jgi:toxin HigB-1